MALPVRQIVIAALGAACLCCLHPARACDTPVYRFAMYNWRYLAPYQVFYLVHGQPDEADRAANETLAEMAGDMTAPANVMLTKVNVDDEADLENLPDFVLKAWRNLPDSSRPVHLVFTPRGTLLHAGRLDEAEVRALVDSPARTQLAELLQQGHAGVLVVLTGASVEDNSAVEEVVTQVIQRGAAGEIVPFSLIPPVGDDAENDDSALDVGRLTVQREDPQERWFVRMLLQVESDLENDERTMVFPAYGRGRVMEPYLGAGVTVKNLSDAVAFVSGACSCEVKEQNPGMDLLTHWDWETAALAVAQRYGAEEGNEHLLDQSSLFPSILMAADEADESDHAATEKPLTGAPNADAGAVAVGDSATSLTSAARPNPSNAALNGSSAAGSVPSTANTSPARARDGENIEPGDSFSATLTRNLGVFAAIACVALLLTGFFLMRPRN